MFINLANEKWLETDNIVTFEPFININNIELISSNRYRGGSDAYYEIGFKINNQNFIIFSSKNIIATNGKDHLQKIVEMLEYDIDRWNNLYFQILEIKTGKSYKKYKYNFNTKKGKAGKRRLCKCTETGFVFSTKSAAASSLCRIDNFPLHRAYVEDKFTEMLNNKEIGTAFNYHFEEIEKN